MEKLRINHDRGFLELNVEVFFPCTRQEARIVFPLIRRWCSKAVKEELLGELLELSEGDRTLCAMYANEAASHPPRSREYRHFTREFSKTHTLYRRMQRNIEYLKEAQHES